jgi:hypothetical protein
VFRGRFLQQFAALFYKNGGLPAPDSAHAIGHMHRGGCKRTAAASAPTERATTRPPTLPVHTPRAPCLPPALKGPTPGCAAPPPPRRRPACSAGHVARPPCHRHPPGRALPVPPAGAHHQPGAGRQQQAAGTGGGRAQRGGGGHCLHPRCAQAPARCQVAPLPTTPAGAPAPCFQPTHARASTNRPDVWRGQEQAHLQPGAAAAAAAQGSRHGPRSLPPPPPHTHTQPTPGATPRAHPADCLDDLFIDSDSCLTFVYTPLGNPDVDAVIAAMMANNVPPIPASRVSASARGGGGGASACLALPPSQTPLPDLTHAGQRVRQHHGQQRLPA